MEQFYCDGKIIRDEKGRHRIFKGLNICVKNRGLSAKHFRKLLCAEKHFKMLSDNGFNLIRLGLTWELIEPEENAYTMEYIDAFKDYVALCRDHGVYVMLDMHQDVFSAHLTNAGDGAPLWAVQDYPLHQKPYAIWAEGYFYMDNLQQAFCDFWHNEKQLQDKYMKMWQFFAKQFESFDNVIAYDYMNEPYVDANGRTIFMSIVIRVLQNTLGQEITPEVFFKKYSNKTAFLRTVLQIVSKVRSPKNLKKLAVCMDNAENFSKVVEGLDVYTKDFNETLYAPFIENISENVNPKTERFNVIEHNYFSNLGIQFHIQTPQNCLYSPHAYDVFVDSPLYNHYSSNERIRYILSQIKENQENMQVPVLFGEWGAGANGTAWISHIEYIYGILEENLWSQIYWGYKDDKLHEHLNRPYPVAIEGTIQCYRTDNDKKTFHLEWEQPKDGGENLIYMPQKGFVTIDGKKGKNVFDTIYGV